MEWKETDFTDLFKEEIQLPTRPTTFFDLGGLTYNETVFSNLYAYYLNPTGDHGLRDLFLNALCSLIQEKTGKPSLKNMMWTKVEREVRTDAGNFIDIVIIEPEEGNEQPGHALVIENKMNAELYNDLADYYDHVKVSGRKIGVVLSLRKENVHHQDYVNITHEEMITRVVKGLPSVFVDIDARQLLLVKEFITHIQSFSMIQDLSSQYAFYFNHEEEIRKISKLEQLIKADMFAKLAVTCESLGLKLGAPYHSQLRYFYSQTCPVYYTIWMPEVFTPQHSLLIIVELNKQGMEYLESINKIEFTDEEKNVRKEMTRVRTTYLHYATCWFHLSKEEMQDFSTCVYKKIIESPLQGVFTKIENQLSAMLQPAEVGIPAE
jgi:hypothetical protein